MRENSGWGFIKPGGYPPYAIVRDQSQDGYIERFMVSLNTDDADVVNHEVPGHGLTYPGHASEDGVPELFPSIMVWSGAKSPFKPVDIKGNYIVDEETYRVKEKLDDILGENWQN